MSTTKLSVAAALAMAVIGLSGSASPARAQCYYYDAPPVYVAPVAPQPYYYASPPVYVAPPTVYYTPRPYYYYGGGYYRPYYRRGFNFAFGYAR